MESLWNAVDDKVASALREHLGPGGDYGTLVVTDVEIAAATEATEWAAKQCPFQIVMSYQSTGRPTGHDGESAVKREQSYLIVVLSVVEGSRTVATQAAKTLAGRVEKLFATERFADVIADDGSRARRPRGGANGNMFGGQIELYPKQSAQPNQKYGVAITTFTVTGTVV